MSGALAPAPRQLPAVATLPALPAELPQQPYPAPARWLARTVLRLYGLRFVGGFAATPRLVFIGAPHTSNHDGIAALAAVVALGLRITLIGKRQLFWWPLSILLRALGVVPVARDVPEGTVGQAVATFAAGRPRIFALAPEGTRSRTARWRTGWHRIATGAGVPVAVIALDWGRRTLGVAGTVETSGDYAADLAAVADLLDGVVGRHPERQGPVA